MRSLLIIAGLAFTMAAGPAPAQSTVYNVVKDFSTASNPNGPWTYYMVEDGLHLLNKATSALNGVPGWLAWTNTSHPPFAAKIARNDTSKTIRYGSIVAPQNELMINPQDNEIAAVLFTVPAHGLYRIDAEFQAIDKKAAGQAVTIYVKSKRALYTHLDVFGQTAEYHHYVTLKAGQQVYFQVFGDSTKAPPKVAATGLYLKIKGPVAKTDL